MQRRLMVAGAIVLGLLIVAIAAGCGRGNSGSGEVVARVNGTDITRDQVMKVLEQQNNGQMGQQALDAVIVDQLIRQKAKERGITASKEEIDRRIEPLKDMILAETGQTWDEWLKSTGQTMDDVREGVSQQVLTSRLLITESDMKKYFEAHQQELMDPQTAPYNSESIIYRRLVTNTKAEAEGLRKELTGSKTPDFAKTASEKSMDPMTRPRGGMAGWIVKGKEKPEDKDVAKVLFTLKPGEISQPLPFRSPMYAQLAQQQGGAAATAPEQWQLVTVVKHVPPHTIRLEDNEDRVEKMMIGSDVQLRAQAQEFFTSLQSKAKIEILSPRFAPLKKEYEERAKLAEQTKAMGGAMGLPGTAPGQAMPAPQGPPPAPQGAPTAPTKK